MARNLILILILLFAFCVDCQAASSRRTGTNEAILTYGDATRDYQVGGLTTWEQLTDITLTSGNSKVDISNLSDYFHAGETLNFAPSGATATFLGWASGKSLTSATIYYRVVAGTPTTADTITGATSTHTADVDTIVSANTGISPVLECYDDAASYNDYVTLAGATTSATYFRIIRPAGVKGTATWQGHDGTPNNGVTFDCTNDSDVIGLGEQYVTLQDLIIFSTITSSTNTRYVVSASANNTTLVGCILKATNGGTGVGRGLFYSTSTTGGKVINCLVYECEGLGFYVGANAGYTNYFYNNTAYGNGGQGFYMYSSSGAGTLVLTNCLSTNNTGADFASTGTPVEQLTNCASEDTTATTWGGTGNRTGATFSFVNSGGDDFHLLSTDDDAVNLGTSLAADAVYPFDDDIDFQTITTWDIGFDDSFLFVDTVDERSCVINLLRPSGRVLPMPDATIAVNDRYHVAWYYYIVTGAGSGQESIHGGGLGDDVIIMSPPPLW